MTSDEIRKLIERKPFRRFQMELTSGRIVPVDHPENIARGDGMVSVWIRRERFFDVIDVSEIVALRVPRRRP